jgi:hypothetical protein
MQGIAAWDGQSDGKRRAWRRIFMAAVLLVAVLIAGLMLFSWLESLPAPGHSAAAGSDRGSSEPNAVSHSRIRF